MTPHTERQSPDVVPRLFGFLKVNYEWEGTTTQGREFQIAATFLVPPLKIGKP